MAVAWRKEEMHLGERDRRSGTFRSAEHLLPADSTPLLSCSSPPSLDDHKDTRRQLNANTAVSHSLITISASFLVSRDSFSFTFSS